MKPPGTSRLTNGCVMPLLVLIPGFALPVASGGGGYIEAGFLASANQRIPADPIPPERSAERAIREKFAKEMKTQLETWMKANRCCDLDATTLVAQWMFESTWGSSKLAKEAKNLGGVKGEGPDGFVEMQTTEEIKGQKAKKSQKFRKYKSFTAYYADYCKLICEDIRYEDAKGTQGRAYYEALKKAGYFTDSAYVENCTKVYQQLRD